MKYIHDKGTTRIEKNGAADIIRFTPFDDMPWMNAGFSTRIGGVSTGIYESMNLSFSMGDEYELVKKNHEIMASAFGVTLNDMVYSKQTHTTNVLVVDESHSGMGFVRDRNFDNIDGLVTKTPGLMLVTSYADCVPLFFADSKNTVVASSHSGWRGTIGNIAANTVEVMEGLGSKAKDIIVMIGPSICRDCYEVGEDVAEKFLEAYGDAAVTEKERSAAGERKFLLDLHAANRINLINSGIPEKNIFATDICTCCNPDYLFSHRASKGKRGGMCGYIQIRG